jgi:hypothetical protein
MELGMIFVVEFMYKNVLNMKYFNGKQAEQLGLAKEIIGQMIGKCSSALYYESLTDDEQRFIKQKISEFTDERNKLHIDEPETLEATINKYGSLLKNGLVTIDYLLYGKTFERKLA